MKKNYVRIIVLVVAIVMMAIVFTGCSDQDANGGSAKVVDKYSEWEIISVDASVYYSKSFGRKSCIVLTAIDADNNVHTMDLYDNDIVIIESGDPYLHCEESYGTYDTTLRITKDDLAAYLND